MKIHIASLFLFALSMSSCFKMPLSATGKLDGTASGTVQAASTALGDGKEYASVDSDSKDPVQLTTPKTAGLSGASVLIAPGSLGISVSIVVEQASDFAETSIANEIGLADNILVTSASAGMIIRPSEQVDLKKPLSLAMPLPVGLGFRLANLGSKYAIFYKYFDPTEQKLLTGLKVVDGVNVRMVFDEKSGKDVLQFEGYFGAYWAAVLSREVAVSEVPAPKATEEPIINKAKVPVFTSTGVVKEAEVVLKQAIPELIWDKPIIKFSPESRTVTAFVAVPKGHSVSACKVDFFEATSLAKGISFEVPLGTSAEYSVAKPTEHNLVSRFRCVDEDNRVTITPWSDLLSIPAVAPLPTNDSDIAAEVCGATPSNLYAQGYNAQGQFTPFENFLAVSKCKYRAIINVNNSGNFYISNFNSNVICGLATHSLAEGEQVISCQKGSYANIGSNHMTIPAGNFYVDLDFSKSTTSPALTLTRIPCDRGDFYVLFSDSTQSPTFPAVSIESKMQHRGACEYVYEKPTLPLSANGSMQIRNASGTYSCGSNMNWMPGMMMSDRCGSGSLRYDQFAAPEAAQSHKIILSLGDRAKLRTNNLAQESNVEYSVVSQCPSHLFMLSTAKGTVPDYEKNAAYRQGACRYDFAVPVDDLNKAVYNFKIANLSGATLCGGAYADGAITLNCSANAPAINFEGQLGKTVKVSISGNAITGQLTSASYSRMPTSCMGGLYLQSDIANGLRFSKDKAFQETSECLFEKIWTPLTANDGFYAASGSNNDVCGNPMNSTAQPTLNGAAGRINCSNLQYANNMTQIRPGNIVAGNSYKITIDKRQSNGGSSFVSVSALQTQPPDCGIDLFLMTDGALPYTKNEATKMTHEGNCNYTFTFKPAIGSNNGTMHYHIEDNSLATSCFLGTGSPVANDFNLSRSELLDCSGTTSDALSLDYYPGSVYRFHFKKDGTNVRNQLTIQNLNNYGTPKIAGFAATSIATDERNFKHMASGSNTNESSYVWHAAMGSSFVLDRSGFGYEFCGLDSLGNPPGINSQMSVICGFRAAAAAPSFGTWPANTYSIDYTPAPSIEESGYLKVRQYAGFSSSPRLGATDGNASTNRYPVGTLGTSDPTSTPGSLDGAATWTDAQDNLWAYGGNNGRGEMSSALWRLNATNKEWTLVDGVLTGNDLPVMSGTTHPGAKKMASSWFDSSKNRLYLFGGFSAGASSGFGETNDLWYYQLPAGGWHFVKGSANVNAAGYYGTLQQAAAANYPPPRSSASTWRDSLGNLWMFGGTSMSGGRYNDVWKFIPTADADAAAGDWVWMGGAQESIDDPGVAGTYPSARSDAKAWYYQNKAYIFGGTNSSSGMSDMWSFDCNATASACSFHSLQTDAIPSGTVLARRAVFSPLNRPSYTGGATNWLNSLNGDLWLYSDTAFWVYRPFLNEWTGFPRLNATGYLQNLTPTESAPIHANVSFDPANFMGRRQFALGWSVGSRTYLYGGFGYGANGMSYTWSDMWEIEFPQN
jgi:hypothetical protein